MGALEKAAAQMEAVGERIKITVRLPNGEEICRKVPINEPVVVIKAKLYEAPPTGAFVAPPSAARLTMGGVEMANDASYADHGVCDDATLILASDPGLSVSI